MSRDRPVQERRWKEDIEQLGQGKTNQSVGSDISDGKEEDSSELSGGDCLSPAKKLGFAYFEEDVRDRGGFLLRGKRIVGKEGEASVLAGKGVDYSPTGRDRKDREKGK